MTLSDVRRPQAHSIRPDAGELIGRWRGCAARAELPAASDDCKAGQGVRGCGRAGGGGLFRCAGGDSS